MKKRIRFLSLPVLCVLMFCGGIATMKYLDMYCGENPGILCGSWHYKHGDGAGMVLARDGTATIYEDHQPPYKVFWTCLSGVMRIRTGGNGPGQVIWTEYHIAGNGDMTATNSRGDWPMRGATFVYSRGPILR